MTQVSVRIDEDVKENAEKTLNDIGLSMSAAITIFPKKVAREHRILALLKNIDRNEYSGISKTEPLSGDLSSYWSRRIDDGNRIVYKIEDGMMKIVQCGSHYRDK